MDDRKLKEYAINIYNGISGYSLDKAFSLFPRYYPKIFFYYMEIKTKKQNEFSMRMIQALGLDKGKTLLNELNDLNVRILKFYVNASFKFNESYRKIEAATDEYDRDNIKRREAAAALSIVKQSIDFHDESNEMLKKIAAEAKKYDFKKLLNDINNAIDKNVQGNIEIAKQNIKFINYLKEYQYKEL